MIKTTYRLILMLCLFTLTEMAIAKPEAEFKKISKAWTLHADGSQEYRHSMELTLFTHTAMNSTYGESFIVYNPEFQELKIHSSYTKQKDGTIVKTPDNAFVEVLPSFAANAPAYNHLKEMVVVHTGLELGATIFLDYSIITKAGFYPALDINEQLQETSPVNLLELSISLPDNSPISWQLIGCDAKATEKKENGSKLLTWRLKGLKASSREFFQPKNSDAARLLASSHKSCDEAILYLANRLKSSVSYESETFGPFISEKGKSESEKSDIILNHVVNNMDYSAVPLRYTGFSIRDIDTSLRSAYGTLLEKSQLLSVMLNASGIKSEVVAIYPANANVEACGLSAIKDFAIMANIDGEKRFLSATSLSSNITYRGNLDRLMTLDGKVIDVKPRQLVIKESKSIDLSDTKAENGHIILELPVISKGIDSWGMNTLSSQREGLFEIPASLIEEIKYNVKVKAGIKLLSSTDERVINTPFGRFQQRITPKGDEIELVRYIEINKIQFTPSEYKQIRSLINEWISSDNMVILFSE